MVSLMEFSGSPIVRTWCFHCCGLDAIPGQGTKILQATWCDQKQFFPLRTLRGIQFSFLISNLIFLYVYITSLIKVSLFLI